MIMRWGVTVTFLGLCITSCVAVISVNSGMHVWVATEPIQCLENPWERDWLESHNWDYSNYPKDPGTPGLEPAEFEIVQKYYAGFGVEVSDKATQSKFDAVCAACTCPEGHTLYLKVRDEDASQMLEFGFRKEAPKKTNDDI